MKNKKRKERWFSTVIWAVVGIFILLGAESVCADIIIYGGGDGEGGHFYLIEEPNGDLYEYHFNRDGDLIVMTKIDNPNPDDDGSGGKPDQDAIKDFTERHYKGKTERGILTNNPWSLSRAGQGKDLEPIWNPQDEGRSSDVVVGVGGAPDSRPTPRDIRDAARRGAGNKDNDDDDDNSGGSNADQPGLGEKGSPAHPERVNPNPVASLAKGGETQNKEGYFMRMVRTGQVENQIGISDINTLHTQRENENENGIVALNPPHAFDNRGVMEHGRGAKTAQMVRQPAEPAISAKRFRPVVVLQK